MAGRPCIQCIASFEQSGSMEWVEKQLMGNRKSQSRIFGCTTVHRNIENIAVSLTSHDEVS